ncbi:MAG: haloacid dehalogenase type II [Rhodospirillales bacterium]
MKNEIDVCVFDAYGTLLDVAAAVRHESDRIGDGWQEMAAIWRTKQLEYTWLRSLMGAYTDFRTVTGDALDFAMDSTGVSDDDGLRDDLMALYDRLEAYPEVPDMLRALRSGGMRTAILSNGTKRMISSALGAAEIEDTIDRVLTVETLSVYKPDPRVYQLAVDAFETNAKRVLFFSSNAWDVAGASHFGFRVVWVNRFGHVPERLPGGPDKIVTDLSGVPAMLGML